MGKVQIIAKGFLAFVNKQEVAELINSYFDKLMVFFDRLGCSQLASSLYDLKRKLCRARTAERYAEYVI